jgi:group I intron endonuclease
MKQGYIYLITNKINGKQYVGQTARDIDTRFAEHCKNSHNTAIGNAIQKYGYLNFSVQELEKIDLDKLDAREQYWIKYYNTFEEGYNKTIGGDAVRNYPHLLVVEKNLIIDSIEDFGRLAEQQVGWTADSIQKKVREIVDTDLTFLHYHFKTVVCNTDISDEDTIRDWIQTLQIRFNGKHIYCFELQKEFETIAECAKYLLDNGLYETKSRTPLQAVVTAIGKQLHGATNFIQSTQGNLTFCFLPGGTKNKGSEEPFQKTSIYCPQLNKNFNSQKEAAEYMINNNIWNNIKLKTAKLRISDVVNGYFPDYKGYTFERR